MTITYHDSVTQGSEEWLAMRCGLLTASEMKLVLTPTLKIAANDKSRAHLYELLAQRISQYVEPHYISDDMLRGQEDEFYARELYSKHYAEVTECGFITNDRWGFTLGYSPDALVGGNGLIECKSRRQKYQVQTICENMTSGTIPADYLMQCQTGLLVSEREWLDFISYSGGLPMCVVRVWPDDAIQGAIIEASAQFEAQLADKMQIYRDASADLIPTERREEEEMVF
jgi:predicted phage-related endonuclease